MRSLTFVADSYSATGEAGVCSGCDRRFMLSTATKDSKVMHSRARQREILTHMFEAHSCRAGSKRGRVTESGVKVRQGRPREYSRALKADSARACELGDGERQRCRCRGVLHGARRQLEAIKPGDPHYNIIEAYQRANNALARAAGQSSRL